MHRILLLLMIISLAFGCGHKVSHPPTFDDYQYFLERRGIDALHELTKLGEALRFTSDELGQIRKSNNYEYLVGAGVQTDREDQTGIDLLREAIAIKPSSPLAWAALSFREYSLLQYVENSKIKFEDVLETVNAFEQVDTQNKLPLFIKSYLYFKQGSNNEARKVLLETKQKDYLKTYKIEIIKSIIYSAELVGYSKYTSRKYAFDQGMMGFPLLLVIDKISKIIPDDKEVHRIFLDVGQKIESEAKFNLDLIFSYAIQRIGYRGLGYSNDSPELNTLLRKKELLKDLTLKVALFAGENQTEDGGIKFYDDMLALGEQAAIKNFLSGHNITIEDLH